MLEHPIKNSTTLRERLTHGRYRPLEVIHSCTCPYVCPRLRFESENDAEAIASRPRTYGDMPQEMFDDIASTSLL